MHISKDRECPYCRSRHVSRAKTLGGAFVRRYMCRACQREFSGLRPVIARIAWGERRY